MEIITTANHDQETGYRFGVISPRSINRDALDDVYSNGSDPHYESARDEEETKIINFLNELGYLSDDHAIALKDEIMNEWNDHFDSCGDGQCDYSDKEYTLHVSGDNFGIFVMKSPYYTYCRGCSPCAPGAGDLDASFDPDEYEITEGYHRALCLGHDWFDGNKAPFRVFRVDTDEEVLP